MAEFERYTVSANQRYETKFGIIEEEQVYIESFLHSSRAEKRAKELYDKGCYCSIYIEFGHHSASAYWNPNEGMGPTGKNWIAHFSNQ